MKIRTLGLFFLFCSATLPAAARPMVAVTSDGRLFQFDSATPGTITSPVPVSGLVSGDSIRGIDFRPATGVLYALGINISTGRIYTINIATAVATPVGASPFSTNLTNSAQYGFDFIPTSDQIRIINTGDQNLRVNPNTGLLENTDTPLENAANNESLIAAAHDRSDRKSATVSTLFGIDSTNNLLVRIGGVDGSPSPNEGAVTTIGPLGSTLFGEANFDIAEDGTAFAAWALFTFPSVSQRLYTINLSTGAATSMGTINSGNAGDFLMNGLAAVPSAVANLDSGEFFATIQAAINDAQTLNGHTIAVNAGTFNELVTVNKSLILLGANSGVDARSSTRGTLETVVRGAPTSEGRTPGFHVTVDGVTIDGFTVQNAGDESQINTGGIVLAPNIAGSRIRNNIIRNNVSGLIASNDTVSNHLIIERNLFASNAGPGIYTNQVAAGPTFVSASIDNNTFTGHSDAAVLLGSTAAGSQSNIGITNNILSGNGNALLLFNTTDSFVTGNTITNSTAAQVALGGGVNRLYVSENTIDGGATRGIRIGVFGGGSTNSRIVIGCNVITNNPTAGLEIDPNGGTASYTGTLVAQNNWWGDASGPMIASNPEGIGQKLIDPATQVVFKPFLFSGNDQQPARTGFQCYPAPVLYGINSADKSLIRFNSDDPATVTSTPITGLVGSEAIVGLDFAPDTGVLYGLGSGSRLYTINPLTGLATQVNLAPFTLFGQAFGFDVNHIPDQIRVISDAGQNLRLDPGDSDVNVDTTLAYASGDPSFGLNTDCGAAAYLINSFSSTSSITLYNIDTAQDALVTQGSFNGALHTPEEGLLFTVGKLGINPTDDSTKSNTSFDIFSPVAGVNVPLAALTTNGTSSRLYDINLVTGAATSRGIIGGPNPILVRALTAAPAGIIEFSATGYDFSENGSGVNITIVRQRSSDGTVTVDFTTTDGTATGGGVDYTDADQVVTFAHGETSKVVHIPLTDDSLFEPAETILLALKNPTGGAFLGLQNAVPLTIRANDFPPPTLTTQASPSVALGEAVFDTATISGGNSPGGSIIFRLFGPNNPGCSGVPIFTSTVTVNGNGTYTSGSFTPTTPGAYSWVAIYTGDNVNNGSVSSACGAPTQSITATATVLGNIATRLRVETGDNVLIAGFIITGAQPKKVIVRGIGSSLPLGDKLADPTLELRDSAGALVEANDNWRDSPNIQAIIDSTIPPSNDLESAIVATLPANNAGYTAILRGVNDGTGIGVVEAYDLDRLVDSELANISTRGFVSTGDNVLIAGTIVVGKNPQRVIVRAIGPSLPLANKMEDPTLELRDGNGALIEANDNWVNSPNMQAILDSTIPPSNDLESAIVAILPANNAGYTAIVRGVNDSTGIAVVELYALP